MKITEKALQLSLSLFEGSLDLNSRKLQYHFSFLFERNKIVSVGQNQYDLSAKALYFANRYNIPQKKSFPYLHSEISAISRLWGKIRVDGRLKLVNVRFLKSGEMGISKPCPDCMEVLNALGIDQIYWSIEDGSFRSGLCGH